MTFLWTLPLELGLVVQFAAVTKMLNRFPLWLLCGVSCPAGIMPEEESPVVIETPLSSNVNYTRYRRRRDVFQMVATLYYLLRDSPHYSIGTWFPILYDWAAGLAFTSGGRVLRDELFVDVFYHGLAYTEWDAFVDLRAFIVGEQSAIGPPPTPTHPPARSVIW